MKTPKMLFPDDPNIHPPPPPPVNQASYAPAAKCGLSKVHGADKYMHHTHNTFELFCCRADALAFIPIQQSLSILIHNF